MKKKSIRCPYCGGTAVLRDASYIYGGEAGHKHLYVSQHYPECNSYVGVHEVYRPQCECLLWISHSRFLEIYRAWDRKHCADQDKCPFTSVV